jgi:hypothetical protein
MPCKRVPLRCPQCGATFDVPAAWAPGGLPRGLFCSPCLLERGKMVPLQPIPRAQQAQA